MTNPSPKSRLFGRRDVALDAAMIIAHPDDETLWAGGLLFSRPNWKWTIAVLCRRNDPDRAPKFERVLARLGAEGGMRDLDDGPEQEPLSLALVQDTATGLLNKRRYDIILTHSPFGEYTRHRRHEETGRAVAALWETGTLTSDELWLFAYDDEGATRLPAAIERAHVKLDLDDKIWQMKYDIIVNLYGFAPGSWEADATPRCEAFWCFRDAVAYQRWLADEGKGK